MAKLNWDKRVAEDKASHLRQPQREHTVHPVRLRQILQLKQIIQKVEKRDWLNFKTAAKQQKKKHSLFKQLERSYEEYISKNPTQENSKFAKRVAKVLNDMDIPHL